MPQTVLVTGGAGFIGGNLVRRWLAEQDELRIVNLDRLTYAASRASLAAVEDCPRHTFVEGDIADRRLVRSLLDQHQCTAVVHLAAETHVDRSIDAPLAFVETNVAGTAALLQACREYWNTLPAERAGEFRFVHVSTDEVYGSLGESGRFDEAAAYRPNSPYAASKAGSDHLVRAFGRTYGLPAVVTCSSNNYGPFQLPEKLVPRTIVNALAGRPLAIYGDGLQRRDWLHVDDHVAALWAVLNRGQTGGTYNIAGGCERTNLQIVSAVCAAVDRACPDLPHRPSAALIEHVDDRPGHDFRYALDTTKICGELGWRPQIAFETAIDEIVRWYAENDRWLQAIDGQRVATTRQGVIDKKGNLNMKPAPPQQPSGKV